MEFIKALEEEKKKIFVFEKELPLSLQLISQAIETYKQQLNIDDSEYTASEVPVLEEFIPLRPTCSSSSDEEINNNNNNNSTIRINDGSRDEIPDWLRSAQLWNEQPGPIVESVRQPKAVAAKKAGGSFHLSEKEKVTDVVLTSSTSNDNVFGGGLSDGSHKDGKERNSKRKSRRSWSPELHRRFLNALKELGGPHVATPKLIRELMNVDELSNDEVKSHLQKYRLHVTRPVHKPTNIVLVSNTWASSSEYTISTIASIPSSQAKQKQQNEQKYNTSPTGPLDTRRFVISARANNNNKDRYERTHSVPSTTGSSTATI